VVMGMGAGTGTGTGAGTHCTGDSAVDELAEGTRAGVVFGPIVGMSPSMFTGA
jgi:hypothetical protein